MATGMKPNPLIDAIAARAQADAQSQMANLDLLYNMDTIQDATAERIAGIEDGVNAALTISSEQELFKAKTTANTALASAYLGMNPDEANFRLAKLAATRAESYDRAMAVEDVIAKKKQATLLSDPLTWINAQFTLPADEAAYTHYANRHNAAEAEFNGIVNSGTATGQAYRALEAATSSALAQAKADAIVAQGTEQRAQAMIQGAQLNSQGALQLLQLKDHDLNRAETAVRLQQSAQQFEINKENLALTRIQRQLAVDAALDKKMEREEKAALEADIASKVNFAALHLGKPEMPPALIMSKLRSEKASGIPGAMYKYLRIGEDAANSGKAGIAGVSLGSASETAALYKAGGVTPVGPEAPVIEFLVDSARAASTDLAIAGTKDKEAKENMINSVIVKKAGENLKRIDSTDSKNIYAAPATSALLTAVPSLAAHKFITETLAPIAAANPTAPTTDAAILSAATTAIKADPKRLNEISTALEKYYNAAVDQNNTMKMYMEKGLPQQKDYSALLPVGMFGNKVVVNLADPIALKRMLLLQTGVQGFAGTEGLFR